MRIDLHQHLWPDSLVEAMRRRTEPPCLDGDLVRVQHEKPFALDLASQRVEARIAALDEVSIDRAVVSLSTPVGIEALPADQATPLLDAYHEGVADAVGRAGGRLAAFAAVPLDAPDAGAEAVAGLIRDGFAGVGSGQRRGWQVGQWVVPRASMTERRRMSPQRAQGSPARP